MDESTVSPSSLTVTKPWPYVVTARDDGGVRRESGFNSLLAAQEYAKYMDRRPVDGEYAREAVLYCRERDKKFIPFGDGFIEHKTDGDRRKTAASSK